MEQRIRQLDDATAVRVLRTYARAREGGSGTETALTMPLRSFLVEEFGEVPGSVSAGDLAREMLVVLADDPQDAAGTEAPPTRAEPAIYHANEVLNATCT